MAIKLIKLHYKNKPSYLCITVSIATTLKSREGRYFIYWIAPLYP